jgi:hypothetical protein
MTVRLVFQGSVLPVARTDKIVPGVSNILEQWCVSGAYITLNYRWAVRRLLQCLELCGCCGREFPPPNPLADASRWITVIKDLFLEVLSKTNETPPKKEREKQIGNAERVSGMAPAVFDFNCDSD